MNRRDFIKYLLAIPMAAEFDIEKLLWIKSPIITVPTLPVSLYGIPYHHSNATTHVWLGFERQAINDIMYKFNTLNLQSKLIGDKE